MVKIYEIYPGKLIREYPTLEQAEMFVKKFPGYEINPEKEEEAPKLENEQTDQNQQQELDL